MEDNFKVTKKILKKLYLTAQALALSASIISFSLIPVENDFVIGSIFFALVFLFLVVFKKWIVWLLKN